ncbi:MAG: sulfurtransferase-like selenium metabolism protein YedF, partial [Dehalococcoidia bacterium]
MATTIDARGLACPQPVVLTNKAIEESDEVTTIVDNEVARENVSRLAANKGFGINVEEREGLFYIHLTRQSAGFISADSEPASGPIVVLIGSDTVGRGSEELGRKLMTAFIQVLHDISPKPDTIVFMNSGVKLAVDGSQVVEDLKELEEEGTELLACGTCLG